jgi:hypothetical protein
MARGPKPKTYQQRQTEKRQREEQDRALVEDTVSRFSCSNQIATDFAHQCEVRIDDLDFDIIISELAERFWSKQHDAEQPVVAILREIDAERRRHRDALLALRQRLLPLTGEAGPHHHLTLEPEYARQLVRAALLGEDPPRPVEISATPGAC